MGNCAEERGVPGFISEIMRHPSNSDRDLHTKHSLDGALRRRNISELRDILDDIECGNSLPDSFQ